MCIQIYTYIYIYIYVYTYMYIHIDMYLHICKNININICATPPRPTFHIISPAKTLFRAVFVVDAIYSFRC